MGCPVFILRSGNNVEVGYARKGNPRLRFSIGSAELNQNLPSRVIKFHSKRFLVLSSTDRYARKTAAVDAPLPVDNTGPVAEALYS
jgi:hypothetical protein